MSVSVLLLRTVPDAPMRQSLEEVNIYIKPPEGVPARAMDIKITVKHVKIGLKGNPPFLDVGAVSRRRGVVASLTWTCCHPPPPFAAGGPLFRSYRRRKLLDDGRRRAALEPTEDAQSRGVARRVCGPRRRTSCAPVVLWCCRTPLTYVACYGLQLDPAEQQEAQKKVMLERFQEEHPGFDFSGAEFNVRLLRDVDGCVFVRA